MTSTLTLLDEGAIRSIVAAAVRDELHPVLDGISALAKPPDLHALLRGDQVMALLQIDRRSLQRLIHEGIIPHGIALGPRRLRWRRSTIVQALARLEAEAAKSARSNLTRSRSDRSVSGVKKTSGDQP